MATEISDAQAKPSQRRDPTFNPDRHGFRLVIPRELLAVHENSKGMKRHLELSLIVVPPI
jgi:hypothetical protein